MGSSLGGILPRIVAQTTLAVCVSLQSCAVGTPLTPSPPQPSPPAFSIPWPGDGSAHPARQASASNQIILAGDAYAAKSDNAQADTSKHRLKLLPGAQEISWGTYGFAKVTPGSKPFGMTVLLNGEPPQDYYLGIADYSTHVWRWIHKTAPTGNDYIGIPYTWQPVSPDNTFYAAVLAWDGQSLDLQQVTLHLVQPAVYLTGYDIQASGAAGGGGAIGDIFTSGHVGTVPACAPLSLALHSVRGMWDGAAFDAATFPGTMTQQDYEAVLDATSAAVAWEFTNGGDALARYTGPWFTPDAGYGGTGDPGAGLAIMDDDPESQGHYPEGECSTILASGAIACEYPGLKMSVPSAIVGEYGFDLTPDPASPVIEGYYDGPDYLSPVVELQYGAGQSNTVFLKMLSWGASGKSLPDDASLCRLELRPVYARDADYGYTVSFNLYVGEDHVPGDSEFALYHDEILNSDVLVCKVDGITIMNESYAFRFFDGYKWSSINLPEVLLYTLPPGD